MNILDKTLDSCNAYTRDILKNGVEQVRFLAKNKTLIPSLKEAKQVLKNYRKEKCYEVARASLKLEGFPRTEATDKDRALSVATRLFAWHVLIEEEIEQIVQILNKDMIKIENAVNDIRGDLESLDSHIDDLALITDYYDSEVVN
jgi:hypothetical protein